MVRDGAILAAAMVAFHVCPYAHGAPVTEADVHHAHHKATASLQTPTVHKKTVMRQVTRVTAEPAPTETAVQLPTPEVDTADGAPTPLAFHAAPATVTPEPESDGSPQPAHKRRETAGAEPAFEIPVLPNTPPALSQQESDAGQMANAQGDKTFVMVDKALGKIILFENGQPIFAGPALTGESTADQMPKTELGEKFDTLNAPNTKITPAGRYTVERGFDPEVGGPLFDIHEIRGKDWGIAIHQLYMGIPAEHRDARILSPSEEDKHITFGCINVQPTTLHLLMHELPVKGPIRLYILPEDASQTAAYFTPRTSS
jgi:hypothetical protein